MAIYAAGGLRLRGGGALNEESHLDLFGRGERDEIEFFVAHTKDTHFIFFLLFSKEAKQFALHSSFLAAASPNFRRKFPEEE